MSLWGGSPESGSLLLSPLEECVFLSALPPSSTHPLSLRAVPVWPPSGTEMIMWTRALASVVFEATHSKFNLIPDARPFLLAFPGATCCFLVGCHSELSTVLSVFAPDNSLSTVGQKSKALHCFVLVLFWQGCPRLINFVGNRITSLNLLRFHACSVTLSHV